MIKWSRPGEDDVVSCIYSEKEREREMEEGEKMMNCMQYAYGNIVIVKIPPYQTLWTSLPFTFF